MQLIKPSVELWSMYHTTREEHLAKCARVCYASESKGKESDERLIANLEKNKHLSMFRHYTHYFIVKKSNNENYTKIYNLLRKYEYCPYFDFVVKNNVIYISMNENVYKEESNAQLISLIDSSKVSFEEFASTEIGYSLLRYTFCITTQISTSRELNRVSPNNIAEQSTRYVNFGKKKGITICLPHWWDNASIFKKLLFKSYWKGCEIMYMLCLKLGFSPQDARGVLPLDTATKVVYTYSMYEWKHILDLRYFEITGKAHPNAKLIAKEIYNELSIRYNY